MGLVYTKFYNEYLEYEDYRWNTDIAYKEPKFHYKKKKNLFYKKF